MTPRTVLVAGAGLAGSRCAESLRARGFGGRIVLAGDESHAPYERPALSKELLAGTKTDVALRPPSFWEEQEIELVLGDSVTAVDPERHTARVGTQVLAWDVLVHATGVRARRVDGPPGVLHLRTLDDALALRSRVTSDSRVVVAGAGFIGGEVASSLSGIVAGVTVVDPAGAPLERVLGPEVGGLLARRYRDYGVDLRLGVGVRGFLGEPWLQGVELTDGTAVPADVVVVGIGSVGAAVTVDACGRTATPGVYACGDVAAWRRNGRHLRVEHWTSAAGQARSVAASILGDDEPYDEPPYFWSDQFGLRLQHVGHADEWHAVVLEGDELSFTARFHDARGRLLAALAANRTGDAASFRRELAA